MAPWVLVWLAAITGVVAKDQVVARVVAKPVADPGVEARLGNGLIDPGSIRERVDFGRLRQSALSILGDHDKWLNVLVESDHEGPKPDSFNFLS